MHIGEKYKALINERDKIEGDIDYDNNPIIKEMVDLLTNDVEETISFLDKECSEEQFIWMSEILMKLPNRQKAKNS